MRVKQVSNGVVCWFDLIPYSNGRVWWLTLPIIVFVASVFVPHGWWHAVLNLTHTVGVTQNFVSPRNFDHVWMKTRTSRKRLAWKWLGQLDEHYPHLAERARKMNERDNFVMKYDPEVMKRRAEAERRRKKMRHDV